MSNLKNEVYWYMCCYVFIIIVINVNRTSGFEISGAPALPQHLVRCYQAKKEGGPPPPPHTLAIFIELLQKVERSPENRMDMRVLAAALLHRFRVDGLERHPDIQPSEGITPWRPTGFQFARGTILLSRLLPYHHEIDSEYGFTDNLSTTEQCLLHSFLSPAVDPWQRGDERYTCGDEGSVPRNVENQRYSVWDPELSTLPPLAPRASISSCPIEGGVASGPTGPSRVGSPIGDISTGTVIAGIAAGLQRQAVPLEELISQKALQKYRQVGGQPRNIDNLMAATLAGDLAEVAVYQGPLFESGGMQMGPAGSWDDPLVPRVRHFVRKRPGSPQLLDVRRWEMTDAEIFGGIDGLVLGMKSAVAVRTNPTLRLSQLLEMYYSQRGVTGETEVRVCRRAELFQEISPEILVKETTSFGYTLSSASLSAPFITENTMRNFSMSAVRTLRKYFEAVGRGPSCHSSPIYETRANVYVILDGAWSPKQTLRFLMKICEGIDVSMYGSLIAALSGRDGTILSPLGPSRLNLSLAWSQIAESRWPTRLDLPLALSRTTQLIIEARENQTKSNNVCGDVRGTVVIVTALAPVSDDDLERAIAARMYLRRAYPDVRVMYLVPDLMVERFQNLLVGDPLGQDAVLGLTSQDEVPASNLVVHKISSSVSGHLFPGTNKTMDCDVLTDLVSPRELRLFRILPEHFPLHGSISIEVNGRDDGSIRACLWRGVPTQAILASDCADISGNARSLVLADPPCVPVPVSINKTVEYSNRQSESLICPPLYLTIGGADSYTRCYDDECRFPDQIRFSLKVSGLTNTGRNGYPVFPGSGASVFRSDGIVLITSIYFVLKICFVLFPIGIYEPSRPRFE